MLALRLLALLLLACSPARAEGLSLGLPIACSLGADCWIQQYPAHAGAGGVADYACGHESYAGHDGTDFRLRDTSARAAVLASAAGRVKAVRDGVADHLIKSEADRLSVKGRECGNGVVIDHGDGWETQYCHLRQGSVRVKPGEAVAAGAELGAVGYSGDAGFAHVHLTVRRAGKALDPFDGGPATGAACGSGGDPLWNKEADAALAKDGSSDLIEAGFHGGPVDMADLETGTVKAGAPAPDWPALTAFIWAINLSSGDTITVTLNGPGGVAAENAVTLDRNKAQFLLFSGKKRPPGGWPAGIYHGSVTVTNNGAARLKREWQAEVK